MAYLSVGPDWADAVFVSGLQRRDELSTGQVRQAAGAAIRAFGCSGCAGRVAQEFGDHPETAVTRMRWARAVAREAFGDPALEAGPGATARAAGRSSPDARWADVRLTRGRAASANLVRRGRERLMEEGMIRAQAMAARIACARMTVLHLTELHDNVERACGLAARFQWDCKAVAHAEMFSLLAEVVDDPLLTGGAGYVRELMLAVGRAADGMIISSRRRLLAHLRAGDGEGAALEMERHLRVLLFMWRLALPGGQPDVGEALT